MRALDEMRNLLVINNKTNQEGMIPWMARTMHTHVQVRPIGVILAFCHRSHLILMVWNGRYWEYEIVITVSVAPWANILESVLRNGIALPS